MPSTILFACLSAVCGALLIAAPPASAQLYKWVDANGVVNYGDWPPDGVKLQPIGRGTVNSVSDRALVPESARAPASTRSAARPGAAGRNGNTEAARAASGAAPQDSGAVDTYDPYYDYGRRPAAVAAAAEAAERRPRDARVVKPMLPIDPAIPEMPLRPRR